MIAYDFSHTLKLALTDVLPQTQRLRNAMREYENDRWRIISSKVGNGFSAAACKDKATELEEEEDEGGGDATPTAEAAI